MQWKPIFPIFQLIFLYSPLPSNTSISIKIKCTWRNIEIDIIVIIIIIITVVKLDFLALSFSFYWAVADSRPLWHCRGRWRWRTRQEGSDGDELLYTPDKISQCDKYSCWPSVTMISSPASLHHSPLSASPQHQTQTHTFLSLIGAAIGGALFLLTIMSLAAIIHCRDKKRKTDRK